MSHRHHNPEVMNTQLPLQGATPLCHESQEKLNKFNDEDMNACL